MKSNLLNEICKKYGLTYKDNLSFEISRDRVNYSLTIRSGKVLEKGEVSEEIIDAMIENMDFITSERRRNKINIDGVFQTPLETIYKKFETYSNKKDIEDLILKKITPEDNEFIYYPERDEKGWKLRFRKKDSEKKRTRLLKGEKRERFSKEKGYSYYETTSLTLQSFKKACHKNGWNYEDFTKVKTKELCGTNKKYFFFKRP